MAETCKPPRKTPKTVKVKGYKRNGGKQKVASHKRHKPR